MLTIKNIQLPSVEKIIIYAIVIYLIGLIGIQVESTRPLFIVLVPVNIILATIVAVLYHKTWDRHFWLGFVMIYLGGFMIEWLGVYTGEIFGQYQYGLGLGPHILQVPPIMGLNWFLLVYGATAISTRLSQKRLVISLLGATLMVCYDICLEPSAIKYHFWNWSLEQVPVQNYIAWWISAFVFIYFFQLITKRPTKNKVAEAIFWLQLAFFGCLYLSNKFTN